MPRRHGRRSGALAIVSLVLGLLLGTVAFVAPAQAGPGGSPQRAAAPSMVNLSASLAGPPSGTLATVDLDALVYIPGSNAVGAVAFYEGDLLRDTRPVAGGGFPTSVKTSLLVQGAGPHTFHAVFTPTDAGYAPSRSNDATVNVPKVLQATTTMLNATKDGHQVSLLSATSASGGVPVGSVEFRQDGVLVGTVPAATSGNFAMAHQTRTVPGGTHSFTATFVPTDPEAYATSTSQPQSLTIDATATTTALTGSLKATTGTFTATVDAVDDTVPTGKVDLYDGDRVVRSATLTEGRATLVVAGLAPGKHDFRAVYVPADGAYSTSSSPAVSMTVAKAASRTTVTAPAKARVGARPVVRVKVVSQGAPATGKVTLRYGVKTVTLKLVGGKASFKLPKLRQGRLKLTATYLGNAGTQASVGSGLVKVRR
ncbi:Ig-like domain-containing protein [Nocardioides sp. 503]|uniref:Ig-like domain-containing protein n=1 Tax=Nocardioides sp. 503 TaxID=2508326 RepID=UPI00106F9216|nr:Ig-like domain-containing protein [Nocardioides sp. 503]